MHRPGANVGEVGGTKKKGGQKVSRHVKKQGQTDLWLTKSEVAFQL